MRYKYAQDMSKKILETTVKPQEESKTYYFGGSDEMYTACNISNVLPPFSNRVGFDGVSGGQKKRESMIQH